jgi:hypothetical protein
LETVSYEDYARGIRVSVYTDGYSYDLDYDALLIMSLAGPEQAVRALSAAIIDHKTITVRGDNQTELDVNVPPGSRCRVLSTKLGCGTLHQLVVDTRFFPGSQSDSRLLIVPPQNEIAECVYAEVLSALCSPILPEWKHWICEQLRVQGRLREMAGSLRVVEIKVDETTMDEIISEGVRTGILNFNETGGLYAGLH